MAYNIADCAHNEVCTHCPSRIDCDMRKIFYNEETYLQLRNSAHFRAESSARERGFDESFCEALANQTVATMDHRRTEEFKLHPQYSKT